MKTDSGNDLFEKRVADEYDMYSSFKKIETFPVDELKQQFRGSFFGCLFLPFMYLFLRPLSNKAVKDELKKRGYPAAEMRANEITSQQRIRIAICSALRDQPKDEIVTEAVFLKAITRTLIELAKDESLHISKDPILFAVVSYIIFSHGVNAYCSGSGEWS